VRLKLAESASPTVQIDLSTAFSDVFAIEDIEPLPASSYARAQGTRYLFKLGAPSGERQITLHVRALHPSLATPMQMRINGGEPLHLTPVVLP
jgi:hypothetical protein